jgi:HSP20 family protein
MPRDVRGYLARDRMFEHLERQMDDFVQRIFNRPAHSAYQRAWAPHVDVYETDDEFIAVAELAGVDPSSVTIEIEGESVVLSGERRATTPPDCADCSDYLQLEIPFGEFERTLLLPSAVVADRATANYDDGLLTVRLPKAPVSSERVQVNIQRAE